jgi:hypothetical protein
MTLVRELRRRTARRTPDPSEHCDLCGTGVAAAHRHLLQLDDRQILCSCETCFALHSGDPAFLPTGDRVVWLDRFTLPEEVWSSFRIPIGLAFFFDSSAAGAVTGFYPSPAGATESELELESWTELVAANPILGTLAADVEALVVNRLADPPQFAIAPIDRCYALVGLVKLRWEGISGGTELGAAIEGFFDELRRDAA